MPTYVRTEKCDGCKGQDKTACMYICPHDLMLLDKDGSQTGHAMKAFNQEPEQCWWTIKFRNGNMKRFKFPIRTTPEGSIQPYTGKPDATMSEVDDHSTLFTKGTHSCDMSQFAAS